MEERAQGYKGAKKGHGQQPDKGRMGLGLVLVPWGACKGHTQGDQGSGARATASEEGKARQLDTSEAARTFYNLPRTSGVDAVSVRVRLV